MRVSSVLVLAILVAGCANRSKSLTRRQLSHCNEICGVQLRDVYKKQDLPRPLHREVSSEGELARKASVPKLHKTLGRERRLHCIRKCLERFNEPNKAAVSSEPERTRRRRATDSQKRHLECPKIGTSSAVVYNWSAILTRSHGNWSIVVSWDPLKDPPLNWTGYSVAWNDVNKMRVNVLVPFTCFVVPKNQTTLRITEQDGWIYPHSIQLGVTTYPTAARNQQVKTYHFSKATTTTVTTRRTLSDFPATISFTAPLTGRVHVTPAVTMPLLPAAPDPSNETLLSSAYFPNPSDQRSLSSTYLPNKNLTPGHIGAICVGIIVGVALVTGLFLRVRRIGSRSTKPRSEAQVFVSYSRADYKWVNENLLRLMDRHNITYLIDYKDFEPGRPWIETMVDCIQRSHKVLVIMSQEYMSRKNCQAELQHAMYWARGGKRLVVLRINNVDKGTLPGSIRNRTFIDYADMIERQTWKKRLVNILKTARLSNQPQISINFSSSDTSCETKV